MNSDLVRFGIVGCGDHVIENLLPAACAVRGARCIWISDPQLEVAAAVANSIRDCEAFTDWERAVDLRPPDALLVAATPQIHYAAAKRCLESRIAVFTEKPPTISTLELKQLALLAQNAHVSTMVGHNLRYAEASQQLNQIIQEADFGQKIAMEMRYLASKPIGDRWNLNNPLRSFLLSHVSHAIDFMIYQMGPLQGVDASLMREHNGTTTLCAHLSFLSGGIGTLLASTAAPHFDISATILGSGGKIATMNNLGEIVAFGHKDDFKRWGRKWVSRTLNTGYVFAGYQAELEIFFNSIRSGSPFQSHPSFAEEISVYEIIDLIENML